MEIKQVPLSEVATVKGLIGGPFGSSLVNNDYMPIGVPVIRGTNLGYGKYLGGEFAYVSNAKVAQDLARNVAIVGDVVFTQRGTLGQVAIVPASAFEQYVISQSQMRLRVNSNAAVSEYVYYACSSALFQKQVADNAISTGVPHINLGILNRLTIPLPAVSEQRAIAEVLGALDDKIAANTKLAFTLADLVSTKFMEASRTAINSVKLSEIVTTQYGLTTSAHDGEGPKFLRVTDINKKPWVEWDSTPSCTVDPNDLAKYRVEAGDILVARMADPGKAAFIDEGDPVAVFASYLVRLRALDTRQSMYIYYFLRSSKYLEYTEGAMQGSVQMNMNAKVIVATDIPMPSPEIIENFRATVAVLRRSIQAALQENRTLAETRDVLLPQLMSGKLRVRDAEKAVEAVV